MDRVVKGFTGYSAEKEGKPATHVILSISEYNSLIESAEKAKNETQMIKNKANKVMAEYKQNSERAVSEAKENAQKRTESLQNDLKKSGIEIDRLNSLNANLLRICKERANSKRGLKPKKEHDGYLVLDSQQQNYTFRKNKSTEIFPCWRVRIQTPFDSSIPYDTICKNIEEDLLHVFGAKLGIELVYGNLDRFNIEGIQGLWKGDKNFSFKATYKANYKSGFWEVEYLIKSGVIVPEDMRIV